MQLGSVGWEPGHGDFSYHPFTFFTCSCSEGFRGSRAFGTNFHFLSVFVVFEKKFMVQGEDKLKGTAHAKLEENRQRFEQKK